MKTSETKHQKNLEGKFELGDILTLLDGKLWKVVGTYGFHGEEWVLLRGTNGERMDYTIGSLVTYIQK